MTEKLHTGHRERLRQRLMTYGADALCEHELLELMLFYALPRINTNELAHSLINEFGTLNNILNASVDELTRVKGVGVPTAEFIRLIAEMCGDY
ncbi:MAG: helix-hairpin-helix domain-containing protein, partial [Ruminococcus sp.]|nr:helix-hairpin-helix domain-containing protein [Ruminococcus sp.]